MSVLTFRALRRRALCGSAIAAALGFAGAAAAQTQLPEVVVTAPKEKEKPKPKPVQVRAAPRPAPAPAPARAGARCTAGQSGHRDDEHPQPGTEHDLCADRDHFDHHQSRHDPGASGGRQSNGRKDTPAGPRRDAGFRRQRQLSRAQRARQCASPHQRHHAAGRRYRLRHVSRYRADRQHIADHRRAAGAIWPAHLGRARHPDPQRCLQRRHGGRLWRHAANLHAELRVWRPSRSDPVFPHRAVLREQYRTWKIRRRTGRRSTTIRHRSAALPMCRPFSIPTRASR